MFGSATTRAILSVCVLSILVLCPVPADATHFRFGHLTWQPRTDVDPNAVEFQFQVSARRSAFSCASHPGVCDEGTTSTYPEPERPLVGDTVVEDLGGTTLCFGDGQCTSTLEFDVTAIDATSDWFVGTVTIPYTYASAGNFSASSDDCCRLNECSGINAHLNNGGDAYRLETVVNVGSDNSAPVTSLPPIVLCPQDGLCSFTVPSSDDGGNVSFRFSTPGEAGFSRQPGPPECPSAPSIDAVTGAFLWDTTGCELGTDACGAGFTTLYSTQLTLEDGSSKSAVDFFIQLGQTAGCGDNAPPSFTAASPVCGSTMALAVGQSASIVVEADDPDAGDSVALNCVGTPAGASYTPGLPTVGNPAASLLDWTPAPGDAGFHTITCTANDACEQSLCSFTLAVNECGNGLVENGEQCDDGNTNDGDCCNSGCQFESPGSSCADDSDVCTDDVCDGFGICEHPFNSAPCDDGDQCTANDVCQAGVCLGGDSCGDGTADPLCGEECDPPDGLTCDFTCQTVVCGNGIVQSGEECDDGAVEPGDGCGPDCKLEEKLCIPGDNPAVARAAKRVAFVSTFDYVGGNADGSPEIYFFDKKSFDKALKKRLKKGEVKADVEADLIANFAGAYFIQLTDSPLGVVNRLPSINGNGRVVAFVSNATGNDEIYRYDRRDDVTVQITNAAGHDSNNPNLRASKGNLLLFDSTADLVTDRCVSGDKHGALCSGAVDCTGGGSCGNPDGNREVFLYNNKSAKKLGVDSAMRQLTAAPLGSSEIGRSVNFNTRSTAFSSTADLTGSNSEGNKEIYRIIRDAETLVQVTDVANPLRESSEPAQSRKKVISFSSTGSLDSAANNSDGNSEIFAWFDGKPPRYEQLTNTANCQSGGSSVDSFGRLFAFHSSCDLLPAAGNEDQSIFVYDRERTCLLPLVIRGAVDEGPPPRTTMSGLPQMSKRAAVLTYEGNVGTADPDVCFFTTQDLFVALPPCVGE